MVGIQPIIIKNPYGVAWGRILLAKIGQVSSREVSRSIRNSNDKGRQMVVWPSRIGIWPSEPELLGFNQSTMDTWFLWKWGTPPIYSHSHYYGEHDVVTHQIWFGIVWYISRNIGETHQWKAKAKAAMAVIPPIAGISHIGFAPVRWMAVPLGSRRWWLQQWAVAALVICFLPRAQGWEVHFSSRKSCGNGFSKNSSRIYSVSLVLWMEKFSSCKSKEMVQRQDQIHFHVLPNI